MDTRKQNGGKIKQTILGLATFIKGWCESTNTHIIALRLSLSHTAVSSHTHTYAWVHKHAHTAAAVAANPIPVTRKNWFGVSNLQKAQILEAV